MMPTYKTIKDIYISGTRQTAVEDMYTDLKAIKVKEGWREFYYCSGELIEAEDNGFNRASSLSNSEAQELAKSLREKRPSAVILIIPYIKR